MMIALLKQFSWMRFPEALLQAFGVLWLFIEATDYFFSAPDWTAFVRSGWWLFCICGLLLAMWRAWPKRSVEARIEDTDVIVEIRIGNVLTQGGAIIVGSNTTFDTSLEDGTISKTSVQGQITEKYFSNVTELDQKLEQELKRIPSTKRSRDEKNYGKIQEYSFGTVVPIQTKQRKVYFVAIAKLNSQKAASADSQIFLDTLPKIWMKIRSQAGMDSLICPILGSGYTRLTPPLTRTQLIQEIIRSFVVVSREQKLTEKFSIIIHPKDFKQNDLNLEELHRFLEHECRYARLPLPSDNSQPTGTPLQ